MSRNRRRRRLVTCVEVAAVLIACAGPAGAHEIGKTQATAVVRDHTCTVDVVVDPDALLTALEVSSGSALSNGTDPSRTGPPHRRAGVGVPRPRHSAIRRGRRSSADSNTWRNLRSGMLPGHLRAFG